MIKVCKKVLRWTLFIKQILRFWASCWLGSLEYAQWAPLLLAACIFITPSLKTVSFFSSKFFQKILYLCMVSIQERVLMAPVRYLNFYFCLLIKLLNLTPTISYFFHFFQGQNPSTLILLLKEAGVLSRIELCSVLSANFYDTLV